MVDFEIKIYLKPIQLINMVGDIPVVTKVGPSYSWYLFKLKNDMNYIILEPIRNVLE